MIAQVTDPQGSRVGLGALLVACYDGSNFVFAGKIGTGFDTAPITVFSLVGARVVRLRTSST